MPISRLISGIRDLLLRPKGEIRRKADTGIEAAIGIDEKLSVSCGGLVVIGLLVDGNCSTRVLGPG
jgi:hypothetical protein